MLSDTSAGLIADITKAGSVFVCVLMAYHKAKHVFARAGGELFMQLEREGIFMEDTAW